MNGHIIPQKNSTTSISIIKKQIMTSAGKHCHTYLSFMTSCYWMNKNYNAWQTFDSDM